MFLQLWPVIYNVNKAVDHRSQSHGREKIKLEEEAISEILVADTALESGAEASDVEDYFGGRRRKKRRRWRNNKSSSKPQQKLP
jgi:hypothetical protein